MFRVFVPFLTTKRHLAFNPVFAVLVYLGRTPTFRRAGYVMEDRGTRMEFDRVRFSCMKEGLCMKVPRASAAATVRAGFVETRTRPPPTVDLPRIAQIVLFISEGLCPRAFVLGKC